ncbi:hypothetical protein [Algoriphagus antarcticus]|uniref:Uncharacterized protein n=1 Tax=Algoriphagus antarcticus TaxID=238540 RepID=A0A3E0DZP3_9BACT|nr:hypothetical protein [Algoriphagus antarcticus]REG91532.1 hypothetical protein C8N25_104146 [Algoriphagus antarcticus]
MKKGLIRKNITISIVIGELEMDYRSIKDYFFSVPVLLAWPKRTKKPSRGKASARMAKRWPAATTPFPPLKLANLLKNTMLV